jgi:hypothetical protein
VQPKDGALTRVDGQGHFNGLAANDLGRGGNDLSCLVK